MVFDGDGRWWTVLKVAWKGMDGQPPLRLLAGRRGRSINNEFQRIVCLRRIAVDIVETTSSPLHIDMTLVE